MTQKVTVFSLLAVVVSCLPVAVALTAQEAAQPPAKNVAILVYDKVELLDLAGPGEVFSLTNDFNVFTVAENAEPLVIQRFLKLTPQYTFSDHPPVDILIIPGGDTRPLVQNRGILAWVRKTSRNAEIVLSVCTGAHVLAAAGLLEGLQATTHHKALESLKVAAPHTMIKDNQRFVDNGKIITSAGVSSGIDASLHIIQRLLGSKDARAIAEFIEYQWTPSD